MSPQIPVPIPLTSTSSSQSQNILTLPKIKNNHQLPDRATLKTLSSFIKSYQTSPTQSTTSLSISIPLQHTPTPITTPTPTPSSPLKQPPATTPTTTQTETKPRILPPPSPNQSPNPDHHPTPKMPHTTTTVTTRPSLLARLRGGKTSRRTYENSTSTHTRHNNRNTRAQPVHHHHRKPSVGDKISGALLKLRGSLTRRPGLKAAGTRRMRGTDGRGSHHVAAY